MRNEVLKDEASGRKCFLDLPEDPQAGGLTLVLNLHGGGSAGAWQRDYFPVVDHVDSHRLVVATPTAKTAEPVRFWLKEADDDHLVAIVEGALARVGGPANVGSFWLAGHSQGGMTSRRLLGQPWWADRVDGFLSLSGGRFGQAPFVANFGPPRDAAAGERPPIDAATRARMMGGAEKLPDTDLSFIFAIGEHEIESLPETSPWADKYGAGPRVRLADVVDTQGGRTHDGRWDGRGTRSWGLQPGPGTTELWTYPGAAGGWVIADAVRLDKGHTEGLEPNITCTLVDLMVGAPGGKLARAAG